MVKINEMVVAEIQFREKNIFGFLLKKNILCHFWVLLTFESHLCHSAGTVSYAESGAVKVAEETYTEDAADLTAEQNLPGPVY